MRVGKSYLLVASSLLAAGLVPAAAAQDRDTRSMPAREQIDRSFTIGHGASVSITSIAGPVTVETGGSSRAEIHILREARSKAELDCTHTEILTGNNRLSLRQFRPSETGACRQIEMRQTVRLVLPRNVDLSLKSIAGRVAAGTIEGALRLENIAGRTDLAGARSADISSVAGKLTLGLGPIDRRGVRVASVAGSVDLIFRRGTGANVEASSVIGRVTGATPAIQVRQEGRVYRARIGAGGPLVSLSSIVGQVRLAVS